MPNNIERLIASAKTPTEFARAYFAYLKSALDEIDLSSVEALVREFEDARQSGSTIFIAGNGGSATTATSMANDLGFDLVKKSGTDRPFRLLALTDSNSMMTAIANDIGYDQVFVGQLQLHWRDGDRLLVISASGNSPNLVAAEEWVHERKGRVVALLGFDGGRLARTSDVVVHVPTTKGEYGPVEDAHLILMHVLAHWFQARLRDS
jgi:D-sedoheptulose 7-phosphate isomerase